MLTLDATVSDEIELDLVGPVADKSAPPGQTSPSADPGWMALSSILFKLSITGIAGGPLFGRGCGRMSGE